MSGPQIEKERAENDEEDDDDEKHAVPPMPPKPPAPPTPPAPLPPFGAPRTRMGVGVIQGADRGKTCSDAKKVAIGQAQCKARSIEGNCDCHEMPGAWICTAVMAVTCN